MSIDISKHTKEPKPPDEPKPTDVSPLIKKRVLTKEEEEKLKKTLSDEELERKEKLSSVTTFNDILLKFLDKTAQPEDYIMLNDIIDNEIKKVRILNRLPNRNIMLENLLAVKENLPSIRSEDVKEDEITTLSNTFQTIHHRLSGHSNEGGKTRKIKRTTKKQRTNKRKTTKRRKRKY